VKCYFSSISATKIARAHEKTQAQHSFAPRTSDHDILYKLERATVADVLGRLTGKPNYSTVRAQLRVLEDKGHVQHEEHGLRFIYVPTVPRHIARRSALRHLVETFFEGSAEKVVAALLVARFPESPRKNWTAWLGSSQKTQRRADHECTPQLRTVARAVNRVLCEITCLLVSHGLLRLLRVAGPLLSDICVVLGNSRLTHLAFAHAAASSMAFRHAVECKPPFWLRAWNGAGPVPTRCVR